MGKTTSKTLRIFLAAILAVSCSPVAAYADSWELQEPSLNLESSSMDAGFEAAFEADEESVETIEEDEQPSFDSTVADSIESEPVQALEEAVVYEAPPGFTELTDVTLYPINSFNLRIYSNGLRCGKNESDKVVFKFVPETTADEFGYRVLSIARADEDGLNAIYDTSFDSVYSFSPEDTFDFNFMASGRYRINVNVQAKHLISPAPDAPEGASPQYSLSYARIAATFVIDDPAYPSTEAVADDIARQCLDAGNRTDYDKALWLHNWLIDHCKYDYGYNYAGAEGALIRGIGTCQAYHSAYRMLLDRVDVDSGRIAAGIHVWTAVKMDGEWYHVDVTWDDIDYNPQPQFPEERQLYFGLTDELMEIAHPGHNAAAAGHASSSLKNNYLVRSGRIKNYSSPYVALIQQKLDAGERSFTLNAANASWPESLSDARNIVNNIVAYDLSNSPWSVDGKGAKLTVSYQDGAMSIRAIVEGEVDSLPFYPGLHTLTGALRYGKPDGKYAQNEWIIIEGRWYHFDSNGIVQTGWLKDGGNKFYLDSSGVMATGWRWVDGTYYYFAGGGAMRTGWLYENGIYYYLDPSEGTTAEPNKKGSMFTGLHQIGKDTFYFASGGAMATGWRWVDGTYYYFAGGGAMRTGWLYENGIYYYLDPSEGTTAEPNKKGSMFTGLHQIGKDTFFFAGGGAMVTGWQWIGDKCYYFAGGGAMVKDAWVGIYYVDENGVWIP